MKEEEKEERNHTGLEGKRVRVMSIWNAVGENAVRKGLPRNETHLPLLEDENCCLVLPHPRMYYLLEFIIPISC